MTTSWNTFLWFHNNSHNCCHINRLHQDHHRVHRSLQVDNHRGHRHHQDHNSRHGSRVPRRTSRDLHQEDHFSGHLCRHRDDGDGQQNLTQNRRARPQERQQSPHDTRGARTKLTYDRDARPVAAGRKHRSASPPPPATGTKRTARLKKSDVASSNAKAGRFAKTPSTTQPPLLTTMPPPSTGHQGP
jgi:hypothetical protein